MARLENAKTGESYDLEQLARIGEVKIGRAEGNDIVLDVDEVSRYHAKVVKLGEKWALQDLSSMNQTFILPKGNIEDRIIVRTDRPTLLRNNDWIYLGNYLLFYKE